MMDRDPADGRPLAEILTELHEALEASAGDLGDEVRSDLREAVAEIRETLDASGPEDLSDSLQGRLTAALERFEGAHPKLTEMVGRMADALADLGI